MSDNFDFVKRFVFMPPDPRKLAAGIVFLGILLGSVSVFFLSPSSSLGVNLVGAAVASIFFYVAPSLLSAEFTAFLGNLSRRWTYVMSVLDQFTVFFFSFMIPFTESVGEAWQLLWLGLATVYLINLLMVLVARGGKNILVSVSLPLIYPVWTLAAFHLFIGRLVGIPGSLYVQNFVLFIISAFLLLLTMFLYDVIIGSNISLSAFDFSSAVILHEDLALEEGVETDVHHQSFRVENGSGTTYNVPWVHPGPLEGIGGGRLTSVLIDEDSFMFHVPSYHTINLSDPEDMHLFEQPPEPELEEEASRMLKVEREGFTLYGRRYGNGKLVFVQNRNIDDYDPEIAYSLKEEHPELCLVDLHNQMDGEAEKWLQTRDPDVQVFRDAVDEMVERLEGEELEDYRAGSGGNTEYRALVEEVGDQKVCILGINGNDAPPLLRDLEEELEFDHTLVFTTDSHANAIEMADPREYSREDLENAVEEAEENVSDAEAGFGEEVVEDVKVLGKDYEALITTMNVMTRLVPISLLLYYVAIVFLVL